ncbi:serine protease homolog 93 precursor [Nasonia vitripennis]|uniref:chymotrypsin n=1 Tax=Nasonia vitripennis TaxID=7425 RepID=A0A7M6UDS4_NASVI|nr:serine protease homolog 93 precursor [Nasonia vitripennis]
MKVLVSVLLLSLAAGTTAFERIVSGQDAPDGKFPYQVALKYFGLYFCGGSIIDKRWILTAAHCLRNRSPEFIKVYAGSNKLTDEKAQFYQAEYLTYHENFTMKYLDNDIGLIRVIEDMDFNEHVQPIALPTDDTTDNTSVVLSGWGLTHVNGTLAKNLQEIDLKIVSQEECDQFWSTIFPITEAHLCTFTKIGEGSCRGDSGGPLVADKVQVGIVSFGLPCAVGHPDVFTKVYTFLDWIQKQQNKFR